MASPLSLSVAKLGGGRRFDIGSGEVLFRLDSYEGNPLVKPQELGLTWYEQGKLQVGAVFNGGAECFQGKIILLPRCHRNYQKGTYFDRKLGFERRCFENYVSEVWPLVSEDGLSFERFHDVVIKGDGSDYRDFVYGLEDIRIVKYDEIYLLIGCGKVKPPFKGEDADRVAIYSTTNFTDITYHGIVEPFDSRNAIPFPRYIHGKLYMLLRFHPHIHLAFLTAGMDQLLNPSQYRRAWKQIYDRRSETMLLGSGRYPHEGDKIGPSTQMVETDKGWLLIYHAVGEIDAKICEIYGLREGIERGYSVCVAILDSDDPRKVLCRTRYPIYIPSAPYELYGDDEYPVDVPAVVFPVGAVVVEDKLLLYCGAGDKYITLLSCSLDELVDYLWESCQL